MLRKQLDTWYSIIKTWLNTPMCEPEWLTRSQPGPIDMIEPTITPLNGFTPPRPVPPASVELYPTLTDAVLEDLDFIVPTEQEKEDILHVLGAVGDSVSAVLKPCPFCGASTPDLEDCRTAWIVRCRCGCSVLGARAPEPEGEESEAYWDKIRQTAINRWNRRS